MAFTPRLTRPTSGNKYYIRKANGGYSNAIKGSPTDPTCDVLANCVGYAYGRFNEIGGYGYCKYLAPVNAENFIQYKGSCEVGQTPKVGACMVWRKGNTLNSSDGAGHVAIVEKVISATEVITSESGYGSSKPFWTQTRKKGSNGRWGASSAYTFLGFIYNPAVDDKVIIDTVIVDDSHKEFVKDVQRAIGAYVDGIPGPETLSKTPTVSWKKNNRHAVVAIIQTRLKELGYEEVGKADGIAGAKFASAVAHFQQDNACYADGEVTAGNKTWKKLLGMA
jgi:peptidoglycan hydrolase-like protein with peptidoglycan-binding domain